MNNLEKSEKPGIAMLKTIMAPDLKDITFKLSEVGLDQCLEQGIFRQLPVIGLLSNGFNIVSSIRDYLFLKKICYFLCPLEEIPEKERRLFVESLGKNEAERQKAGENFLLLLDRLNDMYKPEMFGRVFKALVEKEISLQEAEKLGQAIEKVSVNDIPAIVSYYLEETEIEDEQKYALSNAGLLTVLLGNATFDEGGSTYRKNRVGQQFIDIALAESRFLSKEAT